MATKMTLDGNEATAYIAHKINELIAIYPITPASAMGELADAWSAQGRPNLWGSVPLVIHVAARSIATHALSIFCDHSDVMAVRATGFSLLAAGSVQEAMDFALIAQAASLRGRVPVVHFFDGFRTSHEITKVDVIDDAVITALISSDSIAAHRARCLSPDHPIIRGTAQNPDVFFQAREACSGYYAAFPGIVQSIMDVFALQTGRCYHLFDYVGDTQAERVLVLMGSAAETAEETVCALIRHGERLGVIKVRLYRPFKADAFVDALPITVQRIAVLDRTKEPGANGEPLYKDVVEALFHAAQSGHWTRALPNVTGGRYGLSSKEFTPGMAKAVFDALKQPTPPHGFTVGIDDDLFGSSLPWESHYRVINTKTDPASRTFQAVFYGLGADGTVSANKNAIKIIGEQTPLNAQGYFVYDSKKTGAVTVSHLRFGPTPIRAPYLIDTDEADYIGCHQSVFLERFDVLEKARDGAVFVLNSSVAAGDIWQSLSPHMQSMLIRKQIRFYVIDAYQVAAQCALGKHINTIMQVCFFALSGVLPRDEAIAYIKQAVEKSYGKKGRHIVDINFRAIDLALSALQQVWLPEKMPTTDNESAESPSMVLPADTSTFVRNVTAIEMPEAKALRGVSDALNKRSVWIIGGDGWAYDIGFGGLDHVLASTANVNILVLNTEVYSNTGGQTSKATPMGAVAKFSAAGKRTGKKDLARMAMTYRHVYVAQVAYGAKDVHTLHSFLEAESYDGPSLIIAYAPCIAHGVDMAHNHQQQQLAVDSGHWPLLRYDPRRRSQGLNPLQLDSKAPKVPYRVFLESETRFNTLWHSHPQEAERLLEQAQMDVNARYAALSAMASEPVVSVNSAE